MTALTPKQFEIQRRSQRILAVGFDLMRQGGLEDVRLDSIAERVDCTRGTLYNHFRNREEILVAMAEQAVRHRLELFNFAVSHCDESREKITSICFASMVYADEMHVDFAIEQAIRNETIWQKTSETRRAVFSQSDMACMQLAGETINLGVANRELPLPAGLSVEQMIERVCFGLWSLSVGGLSIELSSPALDEVGIRDIRSTIHHNCNALLDFYQWQPLFDPIVYQTFLRRLQPLLKERAQSLNANRNELLQPEHTPN